MRMHHNARLQHLVHANQCLLHSLPYNTMTSSSLKVCLSHPCLLHFDSMRAGRWLCDAIAESGTAGASEASPPACSIIIYYYMQTIPLIRIHIGHHRNANTKNLKDCK